MKTLFGIIALLFSQTAIASDRHQVDKFEHAAPSVHAYHAYLTPMSATLDSDEEVEWEEGIKTTISAIEALLKSKANHKYEFYERMADRYQDLFTIERARELREYVGKYEDYRWSDGKEKPPEPDFTDSTNILLKRSNALRDLVSKFDKDPRKPRALWLLSSTMARYGQEHSMHYFNQLFKRYSKSEYTGHAKVAVADFYFAKGQYDKAEKTYKQAIGFKVAEVKNFAIYKLGWTNYFQSLTEKNKKKRAELVDKSLAAFKLAVLLEKNRETKGRFDLSTEAMHDFTWLMSSLNRRAEAFEFFAKLENTEAPWIYTRYTAEKKMRDEDYRMSLSLFEQLIERDREANDIPQLYAKAIFSATELAQPERALRHLSRLDHIVNNEDSDWRGTVEESKRLQLRGKSIYYRVAETIGDRILARAQDNDNPVVKKTLASQAIRFYRYFVTKFPKKYEDVELQYNMASAHFLAEDYSNAARMFDSIANESLISNERKLSAAYFRVVSLQNWDAKHGDKRLPEFGQATRKIRMSEAKYRLISAIGKFAKLAPPSEELIQYQLMAAMQFYNYGHYSEALERLVHLGTAYTKSEQGNQAIQLVLAHLLERKQWNDLHQATEHLLKNKSVARSKLAGTIKEHYDYADYMVKQAKQSATH